MSEQSSSERVGVYPGSFNPPTVAHLAVSEAAKEQRALDRVVWSVSVVALAKEDLTEASLDDRLADIEAVIADRDWLSVQVTEAQLIADVAEGFDVVIMGADKWHQINELRWYSDADARAAALARLPEVAVAPRGDFAVPTDHALDIDERFADVSSTAARNGIPGHAATAS